MKILISREAQTNNDTVRVGPNKEYNVWGQLLTFDDGSTQFDPGFEQTKAIIAAEQHNGKAALDDNGQWIPAPGPREHDWDTEILDFKVGLTFEGITQDAYAKSIYDYSVITPTGVGFHGDAKGNTLRVPGHWSLERVAVEAIGWVCSSEDSGHEFPEETTDEQWDWIRSDHRDYSSADIDQLTEYMDRGATLVEGLARLQALNEAIPPSTETAQEFLLRVAEIGNTEEARQDKIENRAKMYVNEYIWAQQSSLVSYLIEKGDHVSFEDIVNLTPDTGRMDGYALSEFLRDELSEDFRDLIDLNDYTRFFYLDDEDGEIDFALVRSNLNPQDLEDWDLELLRDHINENYTPGEIFEWYLVDEWLANELEAEGQATLTDGHNHWWGRRTTGQYIIHDGIMQRIAAKHVQ